MSDLNSERKEKRLESNQNSDYGKEDREVHQQQLNFRLLEQNTNLCKIIKRLEEEKKLVEDKYEEYKRKAKSQCNQCGSQECLCSEIEHH